VLLLAPVGIVRMLSEIMNTPEDGSKLAWVTASYFPSQK